VNRYKSGYAIERISLRADIALNSVDPDVDRLPAKRLSPLRSPGRGTTARTPVSADPRGSAGPAHGLGDDLPAGVPEPAEDDVVEDRIVGRIE
jgi:hypothetical protein